MKTQIEKLSETLIKDIKKTGLSCSAFSRKNGFHTSVISEIVNGKRFSNKTIKRFVEIFGDKYKKFYKYTKCDICGNKFIADNGKIKLCSVECQNKNASNLKSKWRDRKKLQQGVAEKTLAERYGWGVHGLKKPDIGIVDFMNGKQYGDRQREYLLNLQKTQRMEIR
jgi:hypothetical protein